MNRRPVTELFRDSVIPPELQPKSVLTGIDLTRYPVIFARLGRNWESRLENIRKQAPCVIIIYRQSTKTTMVERQGILLPKRFDPRRVRHYKGPGQEEAERKAANEKRREALVHRINQEIPGVIAKATSREVIVVPNNNIRPDTSYLDWKISISPETFERAQEMIQKKMPYWNKWTEVLHEDYKATAYTDPVAQGEIIVKTAWSNKYECPVVGVHTNNDWWALLKEEEGAWKRYGVKRAMKVE